MREIFDVDDIDLAEALLSQHYTKMRLGSDGHRQGVRLENEAVGMVRLDRAVYRMSAEVDCEPMGVWFIGQVTSGTIEYGFRSEVPLTSGDVFAGPPPDSGWEAHLHDLSTEFVVIEPEALAEVAGRPPDGEPVRLLAHDPISAAAALRWRRTFAFVHDSVVRDPEAFESPLVAGNAGRLLASVSLATFPSTEESEPTSVDRHDAHPQALRRAIAFIEANPSADIGVADVARAASVSVRALQLAFQRHLNTTPNTYMRVVRLHYARQELLSTDPAETTVTAIATRWGFLNAGRFAAEYRRVFGDLPSETLAVPPPDPPPESRSP